MTDSFKPSGLWTEWAMPCMETTASDAAPANKQSPSDLPSPEINHILLERLKDEARKEGFELGKKEGYVAGYAQGQAEGEKAVQENAQAVENEQHHLIQSLFQKIASEVHHSTEDMHLTMALIACEVGKHFARKAIEHDPSVMEGKISELLKVEPALVGPVRLKLHPDDASLISAHCKDEISKAGWVVEATDSITRGGCFVQSKHTDIDGTWETQQQQLERFMKDILG